MAARATVCPTEDALIAFTSARSPCGRRCGSSRSSDTSAANRAAARSSSSRRSMRAPASSPASPRKCAGRARRDVRGHRPGLVPASADIAPCSEIVEDVPVFRLRRLRLADGDPMGVQTTYIPASLVPGIETFGFADASLYDVLGTHYNLVPASAHETHFAFGVGAEDARAPARRRRIAGHRRELVARSPTAAPWNTCIRSCAATATRSCSTLVREPLGR